MFTFNSQSGRGRLQLLSLMGGIDQDLLAFVSGLDPEEGLAKKQSDVTVAGRGAVKEEKRSKGQPIPTPSQTFASNEQVSLAELANTIIGGDETGFSNLKRQLNIISEDSATKDGVDNKYGHSASKVRLVEAPLPTIQKERIDRQVAYSHIKTEVAKWDPVIRRNRNLKQQSFPLGAPPAAGVSTLTLISKYKPANEFEQALEKALIEHGNEITESGIQKLENMEMNKLDPAEVERRFAELAKNRSLLFFQERKTRHQSKIKSKLYRKIKAKSRAKEQAAKDRVSLEDPQRLKDRKLKAELARAKERLTLKTRKANKWAQDMLHKGGIDPTTRTEIIEQLRDKERLRQEIMGACEIENEQSESEGENSEEEEDQEDEEEQQEYIESEVDAGKRLRKGFKRGQIDQLAADKDSSDNEDDFFQPEMDESDEQEGVESPSMADQDSTAIVGRRSFKGDGKVSISKSQTPSINAKEASKPSHTESSMLPSLISPEQEELVRRAFATDDLFTEFMEEKQATVEAEQPTEKDVTLPGWGNWAGEGVDPLQQSSRIKVVKKVQGIPAEKRLDAKLKHVIINEKRSKAARKVLTVAKVPYPYRSKEEYEQALSKPIGREFNSVIGFQKRIEPRIKVKAGSIIDPIKFVKQK